MSDLPAELSGRDPLLLVMDVDSTLIREEVIELLAAEAGREAEVAAVTDAAMRGELDFAASLRQRVATLAGLPESVLERALGRVTPTAGAEDMVARLDAAGHVVGVVSGGFIEIVAPLAERLGIPHARANALAIEDGLLTGEVLGEVVDAATKADFLTELAAAKRIPLSRTIAVGDGANDLRMMEAAAFSVGMCPKPAVRAVADLVLDEPDFAPLTELLGLG